MNCSVPWPVCPTCAEALCVSAGRALCVLCGGAWRAEERDPCPDPASARVRDPAGGEGRMCLAHGLNAQAVGIGFSLELVGEDLEALEALRARRSTLLAGRELAGGPSPAEVLEQAKRRPLGAAADLAAIRELEAGRPVAEALAGLLPDYRQREVIGSQERDTTSSPAAGVSPATPGAAEAARLLAGDPTARELLEELDPPAATAEDVAIAVAELGRARAQGLEDREARRWPSPPAGWPLSMIEAYTRGYREQGINLLHEWGCKCGAIGPVGEDLAGYHRHVAMECPATPATRAALVAAIQRTAEDASAGETPRRRRPRVSRDEELGDARARAAASAERHALAALLLEDLADELEELGERATAERDQAEDVDDTIAAGGRAEAYADAAERLRARGRLAGELADRIGPLRVVLELGEVLRGREVLEALEELGEARAVRVDGWRPPAEQLRLGLDRLGYLDTGRPGRAPSPIGAATIRYLEALEALAALLEAS